MSRLGRGPLVVEFVGLPGAGKSTVAARLAGAVQERATTWGDRSAVGAGDVQRPLHYPRLGLFFLRHPPELWRALQLAFSGASLDLARLYRAVRYVSVWSYRLALARRHGYEVLILEQGPVQDSWSLMLRGEWRTETLETTVSDMILAAGLPYALVYFDVTVDVSAGRIARRPTMESRFDHLSPSETARQLGIQGNRLQELFTRVVERTGAPHCRVDANQRPEETCMEVEGFLETLVRGVPEPRPTQAR